MFYRFNIYCCIAILSALRIVLSLFLKNLFITKLKKKLRYSCCINYLSISMFLLNSQIGINILKLIMIYLLFILVADNISAKNLLLLNFKIKLYVS